MHQLLMSEPMQTSVGTYWKFGLARHHFETTRLCGLMNSDFKRGNIDDLEVNPCREVLQ